MKRRFVRLFFYLISLVIKNIRKHKKVRFVLHPSYGFGAADE